MIEYFLWKNCKIFFASLLLDGEGGIVEEEGGKEGRIGCEIELN
jgi:hypothetical protein